MCPDWLQEQLLSWMIESAERGRPGFKEMLTLTPCDLFSLVRGRTMWLMGDSMMQVRGPVTRSLEIPSAVLQLLTHCDMLGIAMLACASMCAELARRKSQLLSCAEA